MIQASDLRLGNILKDVLEDQFLKIESIFGSTMKVYGHTIDEEVLYSIKIQDLQPIPLTPEVLEQWCGFEKEERKDWGNDPFIVYYKDGIDIHEGNSPDEFRYATYVKGTQRSFKAGIGVKTLHHLQNLYFALTGTELAVTLPTLLHDTNK